MDCGVEIFSWDDTRREIRTKPSMRIMCCGIEAVVYWARSKTRYISNEEIGTPGGFSGLYGFERGWPWARWKLYSSKQYCASHAYSTLFILYSYCFLMSPNMNLTGKASKLKLSMIPLFRISDNDSSICEYMLSTWLLSTSINLNPTSPNNWTAVFS